MLDLTLQLVLFRLVGLLAIAAVHGAAIAGAARLLGDPGPVFDGRVTLNPLVHLDPAGSFCFVLFGLGWIRPVTIDPALLRPGRAGLVIAALAGFLASLALALLLDLGRRPLMSHSSGNMVLWGNAWLEVTGALSLCFAVFNLVPIPPLTGGNVLAAAWPAAAAAAERYRLAIVIVLVVLIAIGLATSALAPLCSELKAVLLD